jgi:hypothetical protein
MALDAGASGGRTVAYENTLARLRRRTAASAGPDVAWHVSLVPLRHFTVPRTRVTPRRANGQAW